MPVYGLCLYIVLLILAERLAIDPLNHCSALITFKFADTRRRKFTVIYMIYNV